MSGIRWVAGALSGFVFLTAGRAVGGPLPPADSDIVLQSLVTEADRTARELKGKGDTPLYYLSYRVHDGTRFSISSSFGALAGHEDLDDPLAGRSRTLDVAVRVGAPGFDNTHKLRTGNFEFDFSRFDRGPTPLPLKDDPLALRLAVWRATDRSYRKAVRQLIKLRANKAVKVAEEEAADDFSTAPPQQQIQTEGGWTLDRKAWAERLRKLSATFKDHPYIIRSDISLSGESSAEYFVDSDGARIRQPRSFARLMIRGSVKADDGMEMDLYRDFEAVTPEQLPSDETLRTAMKELMAQLEALRTAPVIEPYAGPAIVTNRAAGVFFHEIFGHRIEGHRQKDADEGHTFTHKVGQAVLPTFMSVTDDPTRAKFGSTILNGHYAFDDEGTPAQAVSLVDKGVLRSFLMGRSPIKGFPTSNGHGRAQQGLAPVARQGNLIVSSTGQLPFSQLRERLITEVKKQGKPFGLIFEDISGGFTQTRAEVEPQAFKVLPLIVKRVYPDGRPDELVRGVDLIGTPLESFEKIQATGDDFDVFNGYCGAESGWVPVSAVAPSLLIGQIEVERRKPSHDRPPLLPPPLHPDVTWPRPDESAGTPVSQTRDTP
jgi:predicted Zn-dependent protease